MIFESQPDITYGHKLQQETGQGPIETSQLSEGIQQGVRQQPGRSCDARCSVRRGDCSSTEQIENELSRQSYPGVKVVSMKDDSQ